MKRHGAARATTVHAVASALATAIRLLLWRLSVRPLDRCRMRSSLSLTPVAARRSLLPSGRM